MTTDAGFSNPIAAGGALVIPSLHSPNFSQSAGTGWSINKDGSAFFFNLTIHGDMFVYSGAPALGNLIASMANAAGTDPYGNAYAGGITSYEPSLTATVATQLTAGRINFLAAPGSGGPWTTEAIMICLAGALEIGGTGITEFSIGNSNGSDIWLFPSGDTTGVTDAASLNAYLTFLAPGAVIRLVTGIYYINAPIALPFNTGLEGTGCSTGSPYDWAGVPITGTIIRCVSGFTGAAAVTLANSTPDERGLQVLRNLVLDGTATAGGVHGISATGNIFAITIEDCMVYNFPTGTGIINAIGGAGGNGPDDWYVRHVKVSHCQVGISTLAPDSWWIDVEASECTGTNWEVVAGGNSRYIGCKAENSIGGYGWSITVGNTGGQFFTACDSQINYLSGWNITGAANAEGNGFVLLNGCTSNADAAVEGVVHAGLRVNACAARVIAPGFVCTLTDGGAYPPYGATLTGGSEALVLTGAFLQGQLADIHDDGSNTSVLVNAGPLGGTDWNYVGAAGQPAFAAHWANFGHGGAQLAFRQYQPDVVQINGLVIPSAGAADPLFTLPAGYVPASTQLIWGINVTTGNSVYWSVAATTGVVSLGGGALTATDEYAVNGNYSLGI